MASLPDHSEAFSAYNEHNQDGIQNKHKAYTETAPVQIINLEYDDDEREPEIHFRTWIALAAMFLLNLVQLVALQGPPTVLTYIGEDLKNTTREAWVSNALTLVQAVVGPIVASASDTFQARKSILVGACVLAFIGAAIAPGSKTIYRLIGAQILIGIGFATVPLAYCVPSEILPRRWRPLAQAAMNIAASIGACLGPIVIGALTRANERTGWKNFYWFQMALWGVTSLGIFIGYQPPKRRTDYDHLSLWQKLGTLDLAGCGLLTAGMTLFLVGLNLGGAPSPWTAASVLCPLIIGIFIFITFGVYEWKGTKTGILHHDLFRGGKEHGRTFSILVGLIFIEGVLLFSFLIFYPVLTTALFVTDPLLVAVRLIVFWIASGLSTTVWGYTSSKFRTIKWPLFTGFLIYTSGIVGLATIQPGQSTNAIAFTALAGVGFGAPLILIVSGVQLSTPHHLIATATAATTSARAVAVTVFTAIYSAAVNNRLGKYIPNYVASAALHAGLPASSIGYFIGALTRQDSAALNNVRGVTPAIISAGVKALQHAYADGLRVVFIIAAPFGIVALLGCLFLGDLKKTMNYHVDAPVEQLFAKNQAQRSDDEDTLGHEA